MLEPATLEKLTAYLPDLETSTFRGDTRVVVPPHSIYSVLGFARDRLRFDLLVDITCVDYLGYRGAVDRFGLVYLLASTETNERITLRVFLNEPHVAVPSAVPLWEGAEYQPKISALLAAR